MLNVHTKNIVCLYILNLYLLLHKLLYFCCYVLFFFPVTWFPVFYLLLFLIPVVWRAFSWALRPLLEQFVASQKQNFQLTSVFIKILSSVGRVLSDSLRWVGMWHFKCKFWKFRSSAELDGLARIVLINYTQYVTPGVCKIWYLEAPQSQQ